MSGGMSVERHPKCQVLHSMGYLLRWFANISLHSIPILAMVCYPWP